jgi:hypothetical protein
MEQLLINLNIHGNRFGSATELVRLPTTEERRRSERH